jgi:hypothetical protein
MSTTSPVPRSPLGLRYLKALQFEVRVDAAFGTANDVLASFAAHVPAPKDAPK